MLSYKFVVIPVPGIRWLWCPFFSQNCLREFTVSCLFCRISQERVYHILAVEEKKGLDIEGEGGLLSLECEPVNGNGEVLICFHGRERVQRCCELPDVVACDEIDVLVGGLRRHEGGFLRKCVLP